MSAALCGDAVWSVSYEHDKAATRALHAWITGAAGERLGLRAKFALGILRRAPGGCEVAPDAAREVDAACAAVDAWGGA